MDTVSESRCFGGVQGVYVHESAACAGPMRFALYLPPGAGRVPLVTFLSGLTCTEENFTVKAGAQRLAGELGLALLVPDTSPRGRGVPGEDDAWDVGTGAGFWLDATEEPWARSYRMETWAARELPEAVAAAFPRVDLGRQAIFGHSMGGHGALTLYLRHPGRYRSVSALAPIVAPSRVPWGRKAFAAYLGPDEAAWRDHDACELVRRAAAPPEQPILVDQGEADPHLDVQLRPELLADACRAAGFPLELRLQPGYDHGYHFVATFVGDHLQRHAAALR